MSSHVDETTKHVVDAVSVVTVVGTLVDKLPAVAAVFTILWTLIRIWETETVQKIVRRLFSRDTK
ncbi:MAG: hypothetical protein EBZ60_08040 [Betaproteobacteria bacterium]|nr:hypothetical protein [Betaproteobacteria bacterium]